LSDTNVFKMWKIALHTTAKFCLKGQDMDPHSDKTAAVIRL